MVGLPVDWLLSVPALAVLGLMVGSFLNVVAHRLPLMMERQWWADVAHQLADEASYRRVFGTDSPKPMAPLAAVMQDSQAGLPGFNLSTPRSRCPSCGRGIRWFENTPVLSWLVLRGRCSSCQAGISARYPLVEIAGGLLFAAAAWRFGPTPAALLHCGFVAALLALSLIDWDTTVLPDCITLPLLWGGLVVSAWGLSIPLSDALWGAVAGYLSLWSVYWLFKLITGKEGMGYGDFKLLAALGAWLGWQALLPIILGASVLGALVGLGMKASNSLREGRYVPFGPFLACAGVVVMLIGTQPLLRLMGWA